jgi:hypothetical protein
MENKSIGVFIDGGYYAKISEGYNNTRKVNLKELKSNLSNFKCRRNYTKRKIEDPFVITECFFN